MHSLTLNFGQLFARYGFVNSRVYNDSSEHIAGTRVLCFKDLTYRHCIQLHPPVATFVQNYKFNL